MRAHSQHPRNSGKYANIGASFGESPTKTKRSRCASRSMSNASASNSLVIDSLS